jgi:hypothetical protein
MAATRSTSSGRREPFADVAAATVRREDQHEPELRVSRMQRDRPGDPVRVVVRMREDADHRSWHSHIITGTISIDNDASGAATQRDRRRRRAG